MSDFFFLKKAFEVVDIREGLNVFNISIVDYWSPSRIFCRFSVEIGVLKSEDPTMPLTMIGKYVTKHFNFIFAAFPDDSPSWMLAFSRGEI